MTARRLSTIKRNKANGLNENKWRTGELEARTDRREASLFNSSTTAIVKTRSGKQMCLERSYPWSEIKNATRPGERAASWCWSLLLMILDAGSTHQMTTLRRATTMEDFTTAGSSSFFSICGHVAAALALFGAFTDGRFVTLRWTFCITCMCLVR